MLFSKADARSFPGAAGASIWFRRSGHRLYDLDLDASDRRASLRFAPDHTQSSATSFRRLKSIALQP